MKPWSEFTDDFKTCTCCCVSVERLEKRSRTGWPGGSVLWGVMSGVQDLTCSENSQYINIHTHNGSCLWSKMAGHPRIHMFCMVHMWLIFHTPFFIWRTFTFSFLSMWFEWVSVLSVWWEYSMFHWTYFALPFINLGTVPYVWWDVWLSCTVCHSPSVACTSCLVKIRTPELLISADGSLSQARGRSCFSSHMIGPSNEEHNQIFYFSKRQGKKYFCTNTFNFITSMAS